MSTQILIRQLILISQIVSTDFDFKYKDCNYLFTYKHYPKMEQDSTDDHRLSIAEFLSRYNIIENRKKTYQGLTSQEAKKRSEENPNVLPNHSDKPYYYQFFLGLFEPINILLVSVSLILILLFIFDNEEKMHVKVSVFTLVVMSSNILFDIFNEYRLNRFYRSNIKSIKCKVQRSGIVQVVWQEELVIGDIVHLKKGDVCGADVRILKCSSNLTIDNGSLLGHSNLVSKSLHNTKRCYEDAENIILRSNLIISGNATCVVIKVGKDTAIGRISSSVKPNQNVDSILFSDLRIFFNFSLAISVLISVFLLIAGMLYGIHIDKILGTLVGIFVAILPEAVPSTFKLLLFSCAQKLKERGIIIDDANAVETLGSITTLATNKMALIVPNSLVCTAIYDGFAYYDIELAFLERNPEKIEYFKKIGNICALCAYHQNKEVKTRSEAALDSFGKICSEYFDFKTTYNTKIETGNIDDAEFTQIDSGAFYTAYFSGSPEAILDYCKTIYYKDKIVKLDKELKSKIGNNLKKMEEKGFTIIILASKSYSKRLEHIEKKNLTMICIFYLEQTPKTTASLTCNLLKSAQISIAIISYSELNDLLKVASSLFGNSHDSANRLESVTATQYASWNDRERLKFLSCSKMIVSNANFMDKHNLVSDLQSNGHVVGFLGSTVEDCHALNKANVGLCFETAIQVCKESSKIILPKSTFDDIIYGVEEGRLFFCNLQKAVKYILCNVTPQVVPAFFYIFLGTPSPIPAIMLIVFDYLVEIFPSIFFVYEKPETNLIERHPMLIDRVKKYNENEHYVEVQAAPQTYGQRLKAQIKEYFEVMNKGRLYSKDIVVWALFEVGSITSIACMLAFFLTLVESDIPAKYYFFSADDYFSLGCPPILSKDGREIQYEEQLYILHRCHSTYFLGLLICQFANMLVCRRSSTYFFTDFFDNPRILISTLVGNFIAVGIVYTPYLEEFLLIRRPSLLSLLVPVFAAFVILALDTFKKYRRSLLNSPVI
jgi:magnesium-transporting ATPase (P-type)